MAVNRSTIKRLKIAMEKIDTGYLIIPILATPKEAEAIRRKAENSGKTTRGQSILC